MPLVSVVMPVFNAEQTLARAISSTLLALPHDGELVVVDDGSRDSSIRIAKSASAKDKRIRVIELAANGGIVRALNVGLEHSESKYVARMDSDDISLPWRIRNSLKVLERGRLDIAFSTVISFGPGMSVKPAKPVAISPAAIRLNLLIVNPVAHSTMVARRASIMDVGSYRQVPSEDYDLWLRACAHGIRIGRLASPGLLYRRHPGQITARADWKTDAARNAETAGVHRDLCNIVLGKDLDIYGEVRSGHLHGPAGQEFVEAMRRAAASLNLQERLNLLRRLASVERRANNVTTG